MERPNILVFMTDQEQGDVVHPDHPCRTPHASRLAREGILFRRTFCPTAHCCPSRATFLTGLYPSRHGIYNNVSNPAAIHKTLKEGVGTFSEGLQQAGYHLVYTGKWHVTDAENPEDRGWEELYITAGKGSYMHRSIADWVRMARESHQEPDGSEIPRKRGEILRPGWGNYQLYRSYPTDGPKGYEEHRDYRVVREALEALPRLAQGEAPWFLFVGVTGPHDPFVVPERFVRMYDPREIELPPSFADTLDDKPRVYQRMRRQYWGQLSEEEVRESIAHYWGYCTMMDAMFGEVLDALDATGQAENTLVLFLSDHGDYCGSHGLYLKGVPAFREAYHIAHIARWPGGIESPGREVDAFVTLADFAPTFLELGGAAVPEKLTGRSLAPFYQGATPSDWPDAFYSQFNGVELYYSQRIVATREHKYVYNGFDFDELYDLRSDPHEMVNLSDHPDYLEVKREMVRRMWRFAGREEDIIFNPYPTVALAPWGPADAL
jgi:arylsulfatase A-like enzyme